MVGDGEPASVITEGDGEVPAAGGKPTERQDIGGCRWAVRSPAPGTARSAHRDVGVLETAALVAPEKRGGDWER